MNTILQKRFEEAADRFAHRCPPIYIPDVMPYRKDAFEAGAYFAFFHQWISVEEALPELMERVLVAYRLMTRVSICIMKRIPHDTADPNNGKWHWSLVNHKEDVIAWMPIPNFEMKEKEGNQ